MKFTIVSLAAAALLISGCSMSSKGAKPGSLPSFEKTAEVVNVDDFKSQRTTALVQSSGKRLRVEFDKLDNNMGKDFAPTACAGDFTYTDSFVDPQSSERVDVYKGKWALSNNHCALYVQVPSAQYTQQKKTRYVLLQGDELTVAKDALGRRAIITGSFQ